MLGEAGIAAAERDQAHTARDISTSPDRITGS